MFSGCPLPEKGSTELCFGADFVKNRGMKSYRADRRQDSQKVANVILKKSE